MWGFSSAGRAPALHAGGQEFESPNLHHLKQMELLKSAPSGAFLVCLNPIKHNKHSELVDTILTNLGVYCFNSFCCATLFASTSLICSLVKPEWFSKYFLQGLRFTVGVSLALIYTFFLWYSPTKNQYNIQQFAFFI